MPPIVARLHELLEFAHRLIEFLQNRIPLLGIEVEGFVVVSDLARGLVFQLREVRRVPVVQVLYKLTNRMVLAVAPGSLVGCQTGNGLFLRDEPVLFVVRFAQPLQ